MNPSEIPIQSLIPHADNMVFLDRLLHADDGHAQAELTVTNDDLFYGAPNTMPAWVGIEYMAQTIAAWAGFQALQNKSPIKVGFLVGARKYRSNVPSFSQGTRLIVDINRVFHDATGLASFECHIKDKFDNIEVHSIINVFQPDDERFKQMMDN